MRGHKQALYRGDRESFYSRQRAHARGLRGRGGAERGRAGEDGENDAANTSII